MNKLAGTGGTFCTSFQVGQLEQNRSNCMETSAAQYLVEVLSRVLSVSLMFYWFYCAVCFDVFCDTTRSEPVTSRQKTSAARFSLA